VKFSHLILLLSLFFALVPKVWAADILIYSTSHSDYSLTDKAKGKLSVEVSSFDEVSRVWVNGNEYKLAEPTRGRFEIPYELSLGENSFKIEVESKSGRASKEVVICLSTPAEIEERANRPWTLLAMGGLGYKDNALLAPSSDSKVKSLVGRYTLVPGYKLPLADGQVALSGVWYRERYINRDAKTLEIGFTQVKGLYENADWGGWVVGGGYNQIGTEVPTLILPKTQLESDIFFVGLKSFTLADTYQIDSEFSFTQRAVNSVSGDYNQDAWLLKAQGEWPTVVMGLESKFLGAYEINQAKGKYAFYNAITLGGNATYPYDERSQFTLGLKDKMYTYKTSDPLKGAKENSSLISVNLKGTYKLRSQLSLLGEFTLERMGSNVSYKAYSANLLAASAIYQF